MLGSSMSDELKPLLRVTKEARDAMSPDEVIERAKAGNRRFREGRRVERDFLAEQRATAVGQYPAAILLGCIDSRSPAEIVFDLGLGYIFNCRVAGNVENADVLGSLEFATKVAGAKVVLVLGHGGCGAVKGAIDGATLGNLTQLLAKIRPAVDATVYDGERTSKNPEFVEAVARKNIELTIANIRKKSAVIADLENAGAVKVAGAFHHLSTGVVEFLP
jgi:carbonic anhydrase